jgi:hypothetical protein
MWVNSDAKAAAIQGYIVHHGLTMAALITSE